MRLTAAALLLVACAHTDSYSTGPVSLQGPLAELTALQLTFNPDNDYGAAWTPDGSHVLYSYAGETFNMTLGSRCIGMLPITGGTRSWRFCDGRALGDSASMFLATAFRPTGELMFQQGIGELPNPNGVGGHLFPTTIKLELIDTVAPFSFRRELASFPRFIGGSTIEFLTAAEWIDSNNVVMIANRMSFPKAPGKYDTLPVPVFMALGTFTGDSFELSPIAGSQLAAYWSRAPNGDILFVRGQATGNIIVGESTIMRVPIDGGTAELLAIAPDGHAIRGLSCQGPTCLVLSNSLFLLHPDTRQFSSVGLPAGINPATWSNPRLSPDGKTILFSAGGNLFLLGLTLP